VKGKEVKVAWANSTKTSEHVELAIRNGATRNVYLSNIQIDEQEQDQEGAAEEKRAELYAAFKQFGSIDMVKVVPERRIAFVHMASVSAAMAAVDQLSARPEWKGHRISFGSDRCGERPPPGVHPSLQAKRRLDEQPAIEDYYEPVRERAERQSTNSQRLPYRTIYIGGMEPDITLEDLCDVVRGGLVQSVRLAPVEKHCAFVTFVDEPSAIAFHDAFSQQGLVVKARTLKLGWSKPSLVPFSVLQALQKGATRTIYLGNILLDSLVLHPEGEKTKKNSTPIDNDARAYLLSDCSVRFGPVESVNVIPAKNIAFVSFCNLLDAVKALAGMRELPEYAQCKLAYGRDRCAAPVKPPYTTYPNHPNHQGQMTAMMQYPQWEYPGFAPSYPPPVNSYSYPGSPPSLHPTYYPPPSSYPPNQPYPLMVPVPYMVPVYPSSYPHGYPPPHGYAPTYPTPNSLRDHPYASPHPGSPVQEPEAWSEPNEVEDGPNVDEN